MLLTLSDFPTAWAETPTSDSPSPTDKCRFESDAKTGTAETGNFSPDGTVFVAEKLYVLTTPAGAGMAIDVAKTSGMCAVSVINDGELNTDEVTYTGASLSPESFPTIGDRTDAYRLEFHGARNGQAGFGSEADLYFDAVYVQVGRFAFSVAGVSVSTPFNSRLLEQYARKAAAKVASATT